MFHYYFDKVVCLSLETRQDRRERFIAQARQFSFKFEFLNATPKSHYEGVEVKCPKGHVHNLASYAHNLDVAELLEKCLKDGCESVLFFEDDCVLHREALERFSYSWQLELPNNWDLVYLGAWHTTPPVRVGQYLYKAVHAQMSHAVAIHKRIMPLLIHHCRKNEQLFDFTLANKINPLGLSFCLYPDMAVQEDGYSDIWGKKVKHAQRWKLNGKKRNL